MILTFVLVLTVFATIDPKNAGNPLGAFPIAMAVMIAHLIAIPLTGCGINPARSLGPALISQSIDGCDNVLDDHWLFWIAPIIGGLLAGAVYQFVLDDTMGKGADAKPSAGGKDTTMVERL